MTEERTFDLPVQYKDEEIFVPCILWTSGYTHKFRVTVGGEEILFEPDEENSYRARINYENAGNTEGIDVNLIKAITLSIENLFK